MAANDQSAILLQQSIERTAGHARHTNQQEPLRGTTGPVRRQQIVRQTKERVLSFVRSARRVQGGVSPVRRPVSTPSSPRRLLTIGSSTWCVTPILGFRRRRRPRDRASVSLHAVRPRNPRRILFTDRPRTRGTRPAPSWCSRSVHGPHHARFISRRLPDAADPRRLSHSCDDRRAAGRPRS